MLGGVCGKARASGSISLWLRFCSTFRREFVEEDLDYIKRHFKGLSLRKMKPTGKIAAVFVPFCNVDGVASILYTRRSEKMRKHPGEVSFPGGGLEDRDNGDLIACALRETREELGLENSNCSENLLIPLASYHETPSKTSVAVTPVIGFIKNLNIDKMKASHEVDTIFTIPIEHLMDETKQEKRSLSIKGTEHPSRVQLKVYKAATWPVWGMTSYITERVLKEITEHAKIFK